MRILLTNEYIASVKYRFTYVYVKFFILPTKVSYVNNVIIVYIEHYKREDKKIQSFK